MRISDWSSDVCSSDLLSLRTRGIFFIMITLALAQLIYYLGNGAYAYGGDDGLTILQRSQFSGLIDLSSRPSLYWLCWVLLAAVLYLSHRTINSLFGRSEERRVGQRCVSRGVLRRSPYPYKKTKKNK